MRLRVTVCAIALAFLVLAVGCDSQVVIASRSGTLDDDYVEEPISGEAKFIGMIKQIESHVGPIKQYKPMQWRFVPGSDSGEKFLSSVKIVEHEKAMLRYVFVFADDGKYSRLVGFHAKPRTGVAPPGQL